MKIEILYSELCCLYGDKGNTLFLKQCLPEAEFIETTLNAKPAFLDGDVDLCCMYSMSEQSQERILSRLMPYKEEIATRCAQGKTLFLLLGNALEALAMTCGAGCCRCGCCLPRLQKRYHQLHLQLYARRPAGRYADRHCPGNQKRTDHLRLRCGGQKSGR